jgi:hypothetical protein
MLSCSERISTGSSTVEHGFVASYADSGFYLNKEKING